MIERPEDEHEREREYEPEPYVVDEADRQLARALLEQRELEASILKDLKLVTRETPISDDDIELLVKAAEAVQEAWAWRARLKLLNQATLGEILDRDG
jgi:hypothetical protein